MEIKISRRIRKKLLENHNVLELEVYECFLNRWGPFFSDPRSEHRTHPPTYWFVSETDKRRVLKVIFVRYPAFYAIKSAYDPEDGSDALYERLVKENERGH